MQLPDNFMFQDWKKSCKFLVMFKNLRRAYHQFLMQNANNYVLLAMNNNAIKRFQRERKTLFFVTIYITTCTQHFWHIICTWTHVFSSLQLIRASKFCNQSYLRKLCLWLKPNILHRKYFVKTYVMVMSMGLGTKHPHKF